MVAVLEEPAAYHLLFEVCWGGNLYQRVSQLDMGEQLPEVEVQDVMRSVCVAVAACHENNVCHRDIKPENLLYGGPTSSQLKLIDFGLAVDAWVPPVDTDHDDNDNDETGSDPVDGVQKGTGTGGAVLQSRQPRRLRGRAGSALYLAPEVLNDDYDLQCDAWSIGVVGYYTLTGQPPFTGPTLNDVFDSIRTGSYSLDLVKEKGRTPEAADFIGRLLVVDPAKRMTVDEALQHPWLKDVPDLLAA